MAFKRNPDNGELFSTPSRVRAAMERLVSEVEDRANQKTLQPSYPRVLRIGS
jgi:GTP cyclohydrolase I